MRVSMCMCVCVCIHINTRVNDLPNDIFADLWYVNVCVGVCVCACVCVFIFRLTLIKTSLQKLIRLCCEVSICAVCLLLDKLVNVTPPGHRTTLHLKALYVSKNNLLR